MNNQITQSETPTPPPAASVAQNPPTRIQIGGLILLRVDSLAAEWGMREAQFFAMLEALSVPVVTLTPDGMPYVSVYPLEYALFVLGLPTAMKCTNNYNATGVDATVAEVHFQMASLLYGTLTREAVRERVRALAAAIGRRIPKAPTRSKVAKKGRRKVLDPKPATAYNTVESV